jgi:hypothetical protein
MLGELTSVVLCVAVGPDPPAPAQAEQLDHELICSMLLFTVWAVAELIATKAKVPARKNDQGFFAI